MNTRFVLQGMRSGGYRVVDTRTWNFDEFAVGDRIGALDHCDAQNRRAELAARHAQRN